MHVLLKKTITNSRLVWFSTYGFICSVKHFFKNVYTQATKNLSFALCFLVPGWSSRTRFGRKQMWKHSRSCASKHVKLLFSFLSTCIATSMPHLVTHGLRTIGAESMSFLETQGCVTLILKHYWHAKLTCQMNKSITLHEAQNKVLTTENLGLIHWLISASHLDLFYTLVIFLHCWLETHRLQKLLKKNPLHRCWSTSKAYKQECGGQAWEPSYLPTACLGCM